MSDRIFSFLLFFLLCAGLLSGCANSTAVSSRQMSDTSGLEASSSETAAALFGLSLDDSADCSALSDSDAALYHQLCGTLFPYLVTQAGKDDILFQEGTFSLEDYLLFLNLYLQQNFADAAIEIRQNEFGQPIYFFEREFYAQQFAALCPLAGQLPETIPTEEINGLSCVAAPEMGWGGTTVFTLKDLVWEEADRYLVTVLASDTESDLSTQIQFTLQRAKTVDFCFLGVELLNF